MVVDGAGVGVMVEGISIWNVVRGWVRADGEYLVVLNEDTVNVWARLRELTKVNVNGCVRAGYPSWVSTAKFNL